MKTIPEILLFDATTKKNIVWASDDYTKLGKNYLAKNEIKIDCLKIDGKDVIQRRTQKDKNVKEKRTRKKAEVYTPSWLCNLQLNSIDDAWFEKKNVFNVPMEHGWKSSEERIRFKNKKWTDYVSEPRLEIACGEAPYLVSRYDAVDCRVIPIRERIGILDRKLRVVAENVQSEEEWLWWTKIAYENTYGFDFQGDSLYIARENLILSFIEYYGVQFEKDVCDVQLAEIAKIISWNIWQMDAKNFKPPYSDKLCILRDWKRYRWNKKSTYTYKEIVG